MMPTIHSDIDSRYAWTRLVVSVLLATIGCAGMWVVVVVMPAVQAEFGIDRASASLPFTATMIGFAAGNVFVGRAVDRIGYWLPALVASLALGAGLILAAMSNSVWQFALAHGALVGLGSSAMFGPLIADISHWFRKRRGVAVATAAAGNYLAGAVWPAAMPYFLDHYGWRATYSGIGVFCVVTMIPLAFMLRRRIDHTAAVEQSHIARQRNLPMTPRQLQLLLVIAGFGCCMAMSMPQVHIVAYCMDLGYGVARGAEMLSIMRMKCPTGYFLEAAVLPGQITTVCGLWRRLNFFSSGAMGRAVSFTFVCFGQRSSGNVPGGRYGTNSRR